MTKRKPCKAAHHYILGPTTREGTDAVCKNCKAKKHIPFTVYDGGMYQISPDPRPQPTIHGQYRVVR